MVEGGLFLTRAAGLITLVQSRNQMDNINTPETPEQINSADLNPAPNSNESKPNPLVEWAKKNWKLLTVIGLFLLSNLGIYGYQKIQIRGLKADYDSFLEKQATLARANATQHNERFAKALIQPLAWGIRGEMMRGNKELVDVFLQSVVQETDVDMVAVVDMTGMVYLCTNKKFENKPVVEVLPTLPKDVIRIGVQTASPERVVATAPIMGDVQQLGVLYFEASTNPMLKGQLDSLTLNPFSLPKED